MNTQIIRPPTFQRPSGRLYLQSPQLNLVHNVNTLVELDGITAGYTDGIENVSTHRITPARPGWYSVVGAVEFNGVSLVADKQYASFIYLNGSWIAQNFVHSSLVDELTSRCVIPNIYLTAIDFLDLYARSMAGVNTVDLNVLTCWLSVQRVR